MKRIILTKLNEMLRDNPFIFNSTVDIKDLKIKTKQVKTAHGVIEAIEHQAFEDMRRRRMAFLYGDWENIVNA